MKQADSLVSKPRTGRGGIRRDGARELGLTGAERIAEGGLRRIGVGRPFEVKKREPSAQHVLERGHRVAMAAEVHAEIRMRLQDALDSAKDRSFGIAEVLSGDAHARQC